MTVGRSLGPILRTSHPRRSPTSACLGGQDHRAAPGRWRHIHASASPLRAAATAAMMTKRSSFPALFARGGTSNGLVILRKDLPPQELWHTVLPRAMGSPDAYGRQLDGMGSGVSSTSKICVLAPSERPDADVDFTFVQVGIKDGALDVAGNCGNMSSIVGPVSVDEGLVEKPTLEQGEGADAGHKTALVRIYNTNTNKVIHSRFRVAGEPFSYQPEGDYSIDGVSGTASRVRLSFLDPAGAKTGRALPTGNAVDLLRLPDGSSIVASLVDVSNPGVFIRVADLGLDDSAIAELSPARVEADAALRARLEQIRQAGAAAMGLDPLTESVPKILLVFPRQSSDSGGRPVDIRCLAMSMGQAHKAVPLTLSLCLGAASMLPGTIPNQLSRGDRLRRTTVIGHPGGTVEVGLEMQDGVIVSADLHRTARVLMKGEVFY